MQNTIFRGILFFLLIVTGFSGPTWMFVLSAGVYILTFTGFEIILVAAGIDAYFGYASGGWFIYTIAVTVGLLFVQWIRPYISIYKKT